MSQKKNNHIQEARKLKNQTKWFSTKESDSKPKRKAKTEYKRHADIEVE